MLCIMLMLELLAESLSSMRYKQMGLRIYFIWRLLSSDNLESQVISLFCVFSPRKSAV